MMDWCVRVLHLTIFRTSSGYGLIDLHLRYAILHCIMAICLGFALPNNAPFHKRQNLLL